MAGIDHVLLIKKKKKKNPNYHMWYICSTNTFDHFVWICWLRNSFIDSDFDSDDSMSWRGSSTGIWDRCNIVMALDYMRFYNLWSWIEQPTYAYASRFPALDLQWRWDKKEDSAFPAIDHDYDWGSDSKEVVIYTSIELHGIV